MFVECSLVFRCTETAHRVQLADGSTAFAARADYSPAYAVEDYGMACELRDALTRETGSQAAIGTVMLWKEDSDG